MAHEYGLRFLAASTQLATGGSFTPPANCSVSFWVATITAHAGRVLGHSNEWEIYFTTGSKIINDMNYATSLTSIASLNAGTLYHVVMTRASSNARQIIINGALDSSDSGGSGAPGAATLYLARRSVTANYLNAYVEDVRIYNRVISLAEAQTIYACRGIDNIKFGLLHRYMLNEGSQGAVSSGTGAIKDTGPTKINMTPTNNPVYRGSILKTKRFS